MACCGSAVTLAGLKFDCCPVLGGIKRVFITEYENVKSVVVDPSSEQITSITLDGAAKWYEYGFRKNTGSLTSTLNVDEATGLNYVTNELSLVFNKMETVKRIEIAALSIGTLAVVVEDANGLYWYLGKDEYVSATAGTGVTGTAKGDQNAYTITLSTDSETYPFELSADAIAQIVG